MIAQPFDQAFSAVMMPAVTHLARGFQHPQTDDAFHVVDLVRRPEKRPPTTHVDTRRQFVADI